MTPQRSEHDATLDTFISKHPKAKYTFDSARSAPQSELCREESGNDPKKQRECIVLRMYSTRLFEAMQARGFFCALPMDPSRTYMECTPIPDSDTPP